MISIKEALLQTGRNLKRIRTAKGVSVAALASLSKVSEEIIEAIESGKGDFSLKVIYDLAAELNVDFQEIMVDRITDSE